MYRSRSLLKGARPWLTTLMLIVTLVAATGCNRTKPRRHWWEFWKAKPTATETVYHPDEHVLPPPPDVMDDGTTGDSSSLPYNDSELPPPPTADQADRLPEPEAMRQPASQISELQTVHFAYDSDRLTPEAERKLEQNAQWLMQRPNYEVSIEGHSDERGTAEYNLNLGARRAKSVRNFLISKGVDANRLHTISYGEERPLNPASTEDAYAMNRRVQFLVY